MRRITALFLVAGLLPFLSGCVAALIPLAAAGAVGKSQMDRNKTRKNFIAEGAVTVGATDLGQTTGKSVSVSSVAPEIAVGAGDAKLDAITEPTFEGKDYRSSLLRPLGEGGQAPYDDFANFALKQSASFEMGQGVKSVILVRQVAIEKPRTVDCVSKPLAVIIDLDDADAGSAFVSDNLAAQGGLAETLEKLRAANIGIVWISDQSVEQATHISDILTAAQLSSATSDDFLFLNRGGNDRKQERRWDAARNYCIVAMAGDRRSDFDELYEYLREPDGAITLEGMFGKGWFIVPPPVVALAAQNSENLAILDKEQE